MTSGRRDEDARLGYAFVRALVRLLLGLFYRRIDVVHAERIPPSGPLIVACNHHNSVVDAMLAIAVIPRHLRTLANAPLFRHPIIAPFLRLLGALPVKRRKEAGNDPSRNADLFAATTKTLRSCGAILIFPEGRTQPEPELMELRTGAARMLLAAEDGNAGPRVTLLPVGLVFENPGTFRAGRALCLVGEPIGSAAVSALGCEGLEQEARALTQRLSEGLRAQIVEAGDRRTLRLLHLLAELWAEEDGEAKGSEAERVRWLQRAERTYRHLEEREPARVAAFRNAIESFADEMEGAGLILDQLSRAYRPGVVARFAAVEGTSLLCGMPLALLGMAIHAAPYQLTALIVRLMHRTDEELATDKIAAGLFLYPFLWAAEGLAAHALGGNIALAVFLVALLPTGFAALAWRERLLRVAAEARAFVRYLRDRDLPERLRAKRRALVAELHALAGLEAPELSPSP